MIIFSETLPRFSLSWPRFWAECTLLKPFSEQELLKAVREGLNPTEYLFPASNNYVAVQLPGKIYHSLKTKH